MVKNWGSLFWLVLGVINSGEVDSYDGEIMRPVSVGPFLLSLPQVERPMLISGRGQEGPTPTGMDKSHCHLGWMELYSLTNHLPTGAKLILPIQSMDMGTFTQFPPTPSHRQIQSLFLGHRNPAADKRRDPAPLSPQEFLDAGRHSVEVWPVERVAWREAWRVIPQLFDAVVLSGGGIGVTLEAGEKRGTVKGFW